MIFIKNILYSMKPLFNGIKINDFDEPIKRLKEHYVEISKTTYYKDDIKDYEDILLYYLKCRVDANIFITNDAKDLTRTLKAQTNFYYKKTITLDFNEIVALYYQIMYYKINNYNELLKYVESLGYFEDKKYKFFIYFYEGNFKTEGGIKNKNFEELVFYSQIFLNKNSLNILKYQNIKTLFKYNSSKCYTIFRDILKIYNELSLLERNGLTISGSFTLYLYGLRHCNDIDIRYVAENNKKSKLKFSKDVDFRNIDQYEKLSVKYGKDLVFFYDMKFNPKYYMYFMGIKVLTLDILMVSKRYRSLFPRSFVDIINVNLNLGTKYKIPDTKHIDEQFIKTMRFFFKKYYSRVLTIEEIKSYINLYK